MTIDTGQTGRSMNSGSGRHALPKASNVQTWLGVGVGLLYLLLRLISLPTVPFFCDVPWNVGAVLNGRMFFDFPGYVPWHWLISLFTFNGHAFAAFVGFGVAAGLLCLYYIYRTVEYLAGTPSALAAALVFTTGSHSIYFSVVGSSYIVDMLAACGMLYHAVIYARSDRVCRRHFLLTLAWFCIGCILRPMSVPWTGLALLYLFVLRPSWRLALTSVSVGVASLAALLLLSFHSYGGVEDFLAAGIRQYHTQMDVQTPLMILTNLFRAAFYPAWGLNLWLLLLIGVVIQRRKDLLAAVRRRQPDPGLVCALLLVLPYGALLLRYIPHAGYFCLPLPVLIVLPFFGQPKPGLVVRRAFAFAAVSLVLFFVLGPMTPRSLPGLIYETYGASYTRRGLKTATWGTLARNALKYRVGTEWLGQTGLGAQGLTNGVPTRVP